MRVGMVTMPKLSLTTATASSFPSSLELFASAIERRSTDKEPPGLDFNFAVLLGFTGSSLHVCDLTPVSN